MLVVFGENRKGNTFCASSRFKISWCWRIITAQIMSSWCNNQCCYIKYSDRNIYIDNDGSDIFPKQKVRNIYNTEYQETCDNRHYVISKYCIKYTIICQVYSGRKLRAIFFVQIKISPYRNAEGSSQLRSCLCDEIINADRRIGGKLKKIGILSTVST